VQSEIFVVWMSGRVMLMVTGPTPPEDDELVQECRSSLLAQGVPADDIDIIWQRPRICA
jgi:hypothetical protein